MKQNIVLLFALLISVISYAQKIPGKILPNGKADSLKISEMKKSVHTDSLFPFLQNKKFAPSIMMPNAKSKDDSIFLALKGKARNDDAYKILNAIPKMERLQKK